MSQRAHMPTILARTSQPRIEASLLLALAALDEEPHTSPSAVLPFPRFFARQDARGRRAPSGVVHLLSAFAAGLGGRPDKTIFCRLVAMASDAQWTLQTSVSVESHLSRISLLTLGHSLRCLPRALRHGASLLRRCRPTGYGFQKIFVQRTRTQKDFPNLP